MCNVSFRQRHSAPLLRSTPDPESASLRRAPYSAVLLASSLSFEGVLHPRSASGIFSPTLSSCGFCSRHFFSCATHFKTLSFDFWRSRLHPMQGWFFAVHSPDHLSRWRRHLIGRIRRLFADEQTETACVGGMDIKSSSAFRQSGQQNLLNL